MLENITYFLIFNEPLIFYLGIFTFMSFFTVSLITTINTGEGHKIPFNGTQELPLSLFS